MSVYSNPWESSPRELARYVESVLELVGDRDPVAVLERTLSGVESLVSGRSGEELGRPEATGKWSAVEVVQHMADAELVWAYRLRLVVAQNGAELTGYDQDRWAGELGYREARIDRALALLRALREANLRLIHGLTPAQLDHVGRHAERGEESVRHMIHLYAGHDLVHLRQLERILAAD